MDAHNTTKQTDPKTSAVRATLAMLAAEDEAKRQRAIRAVAIWDAKHPTSGKPPSARQLSQQLRAELVELGVPPARAQRAGLGEESIGNIVEGPRPTLPVTGGIR